MIGLLLGRFLWWLLLLPLLLMLLLHLPCGIVAYNRRVSETIMTGGY